jgi:hypothetical protein
MASSRICFQPNSFSAPLIPSGSANAAISAATTPTRATTTPICLLDTRWGDYLAAPFQGGIRAPPEPTGSWRM